MASRQKRYLAYVVESGEPLVGNEAIAAALDVARKHLEQGGLASLSKQASADLAEYKKPNDYYVHGSHSGHVDQGNHQLFLSKDWNVANFYAGKKGKIYAARPRKNARIMNMEHEETADRVAHALRHDYEQGKLSHGLDQFMNDVSSHHDPHETIKENLRPSNIVSTGGLFDHPDFPDWIYNRFSPDMATFGGGAYVLNSDPSVMDLAPIDTDRPHRAEGGQVKKLAHFHSGPIHSSVAGRTDHLPITVESGSYVLPADCVGFLGESNTLAGFKVLRRMFGGEPYGGGEHPYGQKGGPYGEPLPKAMGGSVHRAAGILFVSPDKEVLLLRRQGKDHVGEWALPAGGIEKGETPEQAARRETEEEAGYSHEGGLSPFMHSNRQGVDFTTFLAQTDHFVPRLNDEHDGAVWIKPSEAEKLPLHPGVRAALAKLRRGKAHGGEASGVPIVAAGGEWVIPPNHVEQIGAGDMDAGHRTLDKFVLHIRKEQIDKLKKMAPPRKD